MKLGNKNSFKSLKSIKINNKNYKYFSLVEAEKNGLAGISNLPKSLNCPKIHLKCEQYENMKNTKYTRCVGNK